jgi:hypothetical protein
MPIIFAMTFMPLLKGLAFGQLAWIPFSGFIFSTYLFSKGRNFQGGFLLSLIMIKPHVWAVVLGFAAAGSIVSKRPGIVLGLLAGSLAQLLASWLVFTFDLTVLREFLLTNPHGEAAKIIKAVSILNLFGILGGEIYLLLIGVTVGFLMASFTRFEARTLLLMAAPLSLLLAPYSWSHDYLALFLI